MELAPGTMLARLADARGFAFGVQWHPEYDWERDGLSRDIFVEFRAAAMGFAWERVGARIAAE